MFKKNTSLLILALVLSSFVIAGCTGTLGSAWTDFNSYFNTYYNAKQSYERGYSQFESQVDRINPERPIRIHRSPVRSGVNEFEDAIERGSDLLIRFPESRFVDNSVALIGRSYFFLQSYFNAEQKFIELYTVTESNDLRQEAVIWRARTMLELERYNDGIIYLTNQFESNELDWDRRPRAEAELLLAQFLVKTEQWDEAGEVLFRAIPNVRDNELRARGYFLHGQILEHLGEYEAAFDAYDRVRRSNPYYQMIYFSELKKGVMLRNLGELEESRRHFASMARDNNNFEFLAEINYHRGRTLRAMGRIDDAIEMYREVLYFSHRTPARELLAKTHYGLAEVYRFDIRNYNLAAAHYDTSARNTSDLELLPRGFDARQVSRDFGDFARLNSEKARKDSLLFLGSLPPAKFDSTIAVIQEQYRREMRAQERERRRESSRIINVDPSELEDAIESTENGFLFHLNRQLMAQASLQFQALWDGRPLVDNWRRQDAVRRAIVRAEEDEEFEEEILFVEEIEFDEYELDLTDIPRTRNAREQMQLDLARTKYEIGNLYFLALQQPDSAKTYFRAIVDDYSDSDMVPQAMYSLSEIFFQDGNEREAQQWAMQIADRHPDTPYARRLSERFDLGINFDENPVSDEERIQLEYYEMLRETSDMEPIGRAHRLFEFGKADTLTTNGPNALMSAARLFIAYENEREEFRERLRTFESAQQHFDMQTSELAAMQDSARVVLADSAALAEDESLASFWQSIADSTIAEPEWHLLFPYKGENWDFTREALALIEENHPSYRNMARVRNLIQELAVPEEPQPEPEPEVEPEEDEAEAEAEAAAEQRRILAEDLPDIDNSVVYDGEDIRHEPSVIGGLEAFIEQSGIKARLQEINVLEASFSFRVHVTAEGYVERVTPLDDEDEFGLYELLEEQMLLNMKLHHAVHNGYRVPVIYEMEIPVSVL